MPSQQVPSGVLERTATLLRSAAGSTAFQYLSGAAIVGLALGPLPVLSASLVYLASRGGPGMVGLPPVAFAAGNWRYNLEDLRRSLTTPFARGVQALLIVGAMSYVVDERRSAELSQFRARIDYLEGRNRDLTLRIGDLRDACSKAPGCRD